MTHTPQARIQRIEQRLATRYGPAARPRLAPLDELVQTILSQNTSDSNRDRAWSGLRETFDSWEAVLQAPATQLEGAIRPAGLAGQKAASIQGLLRRLVEEKGRPTLAHLEEMSDEEALKYLTSFRGIGLKTAACVLCFSLDRAVIPVDTHVHRLSRRLGLVSRKATPEATHQSLNRKIPPDIRFSLHVHFIRHGRATCTARRPACTGCVLEDMCPKVGLGA